MNQENNSLALVEIPVKRKRGRPRKDDGVLRRERRAPVKPKPVIAHQPVTAHQTVIAHSNGHKNIESNSVENSLVGKAVSGVIDGSFEAGYLVTVKVGDTDKMLKGLVFKPGLAVPISGTNDIAPHAKMVKRNKNSLDLLNQANNGRPMKLPVRNGVSGTQKESRLPSYQVKFGPLMAPKGLANDPNNPPQASPQPLQILRPPVGANAANISTSEHKTESLHATQIPTVASESPQAVTTQLIVELTKMLQENQALRMSIAQRDIVPEYPVEPQRRDEATQSDAEKSNFAQIPDTVQDVIDDVAAQMPSSSENPEYRDLFKDIF
ncbi:hypothetical protein GIB67_011449 [Kingdonia uniflora]|uniref:Uncharacterized protein n=1 Tax=Kingdonia uniflora TaxID=39325 RepID=A0A7J7NM51_9MAGN|nr:hypothetical protein GIB67_011449 [Kingdonia uniflora]